MGYTADDYIAFIEAGRRDKISVEALDTIAKEYRALQKYKEELRAKLDWELHGKFDSKNYPGG